MTLANQITIGRIVLIVPFVAFLVVYSETVKTGAPEPIWRWLAIGCFLLAAISDGLDGWVARRFDQITPLGQSLDPVADKLLLLFSVLVLAFTKGHVGLPIWFAVLVVGRDLMLVIGIPYLRKRNGTAKMGVVVSSKIATVLQFGCVLWVLFDVWSESRGIILNALIVLAGIMTAVSGGQYLREGLRQLGETPSGHRA
ncbi:MAG: CDP-alcohol phosphatidyltransferase family protein [Verrucomicrobiota bacterium]